MTLLPCFFAALRFTSVQGGGYTASPHGLRRTLRSAAAPRLAMCRPLQRIVRRRSRFYRPCGQSMGWCVEHREILHPPALLWRLRNWATSRGRDAIESQVGRDASERKQAGSYKRGPAYALAAMNANGLSGLQALKQSVEELKGLVARRWHTSIGYRERLELKADRLGLCRLPSNRVRPLLPASAGKRPRPGQSGPRSELRLRASLHREAEELWRVSPVRRRKPRTVLRARAAIPSV
jgi:hypothetical protein